MPVLMLSETPEVPATSFGPARSDWIAASPDDAGAAVAALAGAGGTSNVALGSTDLICASETGANAGERAITPAAMLSARRPAHVPTMRTSKLLSFNAM